MRCTRELTVVTDENLIQGKSENKKLFTISVNIKNNCLNSLERDIANMISILHLKILYKIHIMFILVYISVNANIRLRAQSSNYASNLAQKRYHTQRVDD